jgi:hypothetical protein
MEQGSAGMVTAKHRASVNGMVIDQVYGSSTTTNYQQLFDAIVFSLPQPSASWPRKGTHARPPAEVAVR